jgi:hypothetical protein
MHVKIILAVALSGVALGAMQAPVRPGQTFTVSRMEIHAPRSRGWGLVSSDLTGLVFTRRDGSRGNTYTAEAFAISIPALDAPIDLLEIAKRIASERNQAPRYEIQESSFEEVSDRPYPCIGSRLRVRDTQAATPDAAGAPEVHVRSLACILRGEPEVLMTVFFSQRGTSVAADFETEAAAFIQGVQASQPR